MTPNDAEAAGYRAWATNAPGAWAAAVQAAHAAGFETAALADRATALDAVSDRCVISRTHARFWRAVLAMPQP